MLGFRGASHYHSDRYREGFALECAAVRRVRQDMGLTNLALMIPFCRTLEEGRQVVLELEKNALVRGENALEVYVMCEIPSNALLADLFDERDPAVKKPIEMVVNAAHRKGRKVGICGQAPSDHPDFAEFLAQIGIDSISLNPDSFASVARRLAV